MPWSKHYYSAAEPSRSSTGAGEANGGDDGLLSLSLGDIYNRNNAPATRAIADAGGFRSPVTPMAVPAARLCPAGVIGAPSATAALPPPRLDAPGVQGPGAFAASSVPTTMAHQIQMAMVFPGDGNGVVPAPAAHCTGTPPAPTKPPAKRSRSVRDRSRTTTTGGHPEAGASAHATNTTGSRHGPSPQANRADDVAGDNQAPGEAYGGALTCPPYPWATDRACVHHSLAELSRRGIDTISGELQCKRCDALRLVALDVGAKFKDLCGYISCNIQGMDDRAPPRWKEPALADCDNCGQKSSMRPVISADKGRINWVFLLLTETLGSCTLEQLKYFCGNTQQHRTGAKDRVLYSTYMELCNQLLPNGLFDMESERRKRTRPNA